MEESDIRRYTHKCDVNRECYGFYKFIGKLKQVDSYILHTTPIKDGPGSELLGVAKNFQKHLKHETGKLMSKMDAMHNKTGKLMSKMDAIELMSKMDAMHNTMKKINNKS